MSTDRPSDQRPDIDDDIEREIAKAMQSLGWIVPQSEDDVLRAEAELAEYGGSAGLPEALIDPKAVFDHTPGHAPSGPELFQFPVDQEIEENLARAAREGGPIPPEIEEILRRDREAAERKLEDGDPSV